MKNIKKITCLVISLLMVLSSVAAFAAFSDVPSTESFERAVSSLSQLGIIKGYEDGTFKPYNDVTRAEFTAMLMRTMGAGSIGSPSSAELPFSDVSDQNSDISWAIPNINTAYKNGIINGYEDGTFRPSDNVAYEEAVKMVVCALGYGAGISVAVEPWYANFIGQARTLGVTKSAQNLGAPEKPASRACIAQMLYDSLEVPLVENNVVTTKTFLADYLGYIKNTGFISANDLTSLDDPDVNLRENQIQIRAKEPGSSLYDIHTYAVTNSADFTNKLGYQIDFFYPKSGANDAVRTLFSYEIKANTTLELKSRMIDADNSTSSSIKYFASEDAKQSSANLDANNIVIYNGKLYGASAGLSAFNTQMVPNVGTVTLLDSDKDGKFDVITIWDYQLYYVTSKSTSDSSIVDNTSRSTNKNLVLDVDTDDNLQLVDKNGSKVAFSSIAAGNVICYAESNYVENGGQEYKRAVVVTDKVNGPISSTISGEEMKVNGTTYKFSYAAPWMITGNDGILEEPKSSDNGTYSLDILGDVFAYSKTTEVVNQLYGYVLAYNQGSSTFASIDEFQVRILTQNGAKTDYHIKKGTMVNGISCNSTDDFLNALETGASYQKTGDTSRTAIQQVIKFTETSYRGNPCLESVYTVDYNTDANGGQIIESDKLYNLANLNRGNVPLKYYNGTLSAGDTSVTVNSSTIVFVLPAQDKRDDTDSFRKTTYSQFSTNKTYSSVEAFDVSRTNAAKVVVLYDSNSATEVDDASPLYVINSAVNNSLNSSTGDYMNKVSGYKITRNSTTGTFDDWISTSSNSVARNMQIGDIFRVGEDSDGYKTFSNNYKVYPATDCYIDCGSTSISNWQSAEYCVIYGSVYACDATDGMVVVPEYINEFTEESTAKQYTITASNFTGAKILKYTKQNDKIKLEDATADREAVLDGITGFDDGLNPAKVVLYMFEGRVKLFAVVEGY